MQCISCNSRDIYEEDTCELSCNNCGYIWENETAIEEEVNFDKGQRIVNGIKIDLNHAKEKRKKRMDEMMTEVAVQIKIDRKVVDKGLEIFCSNSEKGFTKGIPNNRIAAASLYLASQSFGSKISMKELCNCFDVKLKLIRKDVTRFNRITNIALEPIDVITMFKSYVNIAKLNEKEKLLILKNESLLATLSNHTSNLCRKPSSLIATVLLIISHQHKLNMSVNDILELTGVSKLTIRTILTNLNHWKQLSILKDIEEICKKKLK